MKLLSANVLRTDVEKKIFNGLRSRRARIFDEFLDKEKTRIGMKALISRGVESQAMAALADQAVFNGGNFLRGVILARMVSQAEFGLFTLGWTVIVFLESLHTNLVSTPYTVFSPRLKGTELARFTGSALIQHLILTGTLAVVGVIASFGMILMGSSKELLALAWTITLAIVPILLRDHIRRLCFARLWMKSAIAVDLSIVTIQLGLLISVGVLAGLSAPVAFMIIGSGSLVVTVAWIAIHRSEIKVVWPLDKADIDQNWRLGKWGLASAVLWVSATSVYPWILAAFHGTGAAGIWAACVGVVALCNPVIWGLQNFILPKASHVFADGGANALRLFVPRAALMVGGSALALSVVLVPVGGWLVKTIYGDSYSGNGLVVAMLLANFSVLSLDFCFSRGLFILERADIDFRINIIPAVLVFLIGIWIVSEIGVTGAALSMLIGNAVALVLRIVSFYRIGRRAVATR